ncbi:MAG: hypothetical protein KAQ65_01735 [Candidatus Thorarchaeota archaeon]|nr:hypothetical protein [Candidatus Thorarchaeota archaeon]MCK5238306.1 hypothetical protein [Candidatus Thorarchaeota archaeon]
MIRLLRPPARPDHEEPDPYSFVLAPGNPNDDPYSFALAPGNPNDDPY